MHKSDYVNFYTQDRMQEISLNVKSSLRYLPKYREEVFD